MKSSIGLAKAIKTIKKPFQLDVLGLRCCNLSLYVDFSYRKPVEKSQLHRDICVTGYVWPYLSKKVNFGCLFPSENLKTSMTLFRRNCYLKKLATWLFKCHKESKDIYLNSFYFV